MNAQIITIGDELLIGQTIDTNSAWIGNELSLAGFDIQRKISVHDRRGDILQVLGEVTGRAELVIITGGLGPTSDDITKPALCEFFNTKLVLNQEVLGMIEAIMHQRNIQMNENNRRQAEVPESCTVLTNALGTAPGMWFEKSGTIFISLPGVPYEMKHIMSEHVIPLLKERFTSQMIIHRNIMTYGLPEAKLAEVLGTFEAELPEQIKLAYLPSYGVIKLRLTAIGQNRGDLTELIDYQIKNLKTIIPDLIFSENEDNLATVIGKLLRERKRTLSTAESCTGGNIAHMITSVPGSSEYYEGSVIAYSNKVKERFLGISDSLIGREGAVSESVVRNMADGARHLFKTDYSLATSGIAGPDGGTEEKPVGTLWIAVASSSGSIAEKHTYGNDRGTNIMRFSHAALNLLRKQILKD